VVASAKTAGAVRRLRQDQGAQAGMMETFTLIIWLYTGLRFEETQISNLDRGECVERLMSIQADRGPAKGRCVGARGTVAPAEIRSLPLCVHGGGSCSWPLLPRRRRV
jgi:hypothetical protein